MILHYKKNNNPIFKNKFKNDGRMIKNNNTYSLDEKYYIFENIKETDQALLDIGVPSYCENIINGNEEVDESIDQLAKFCLTQDFLLADQLFEPLFISSIIELIKNQESLSLNLIILIRNMWGQSIENIDILFSDDLVSSFCLYLYTPPEIRDFVYESFDFLLQKVSNDANQQIMNILMDFSIIDSLDEYFEFLKTVDYSLFDPARLQGMAKRAINFVHSLVFNPFFNYDFLMNLISYSLLILSDDFFQSYNSTSISILYHIIIDLDEAKLFISSFENVQILMNAHFFNNHTTFSKLYEIDSTLWKYNEINLIYLNEPHFIENIALLLTDQNFYDYLKPIFIFLNNRMSDLWSILYSTYTNFEEEDNQQLIYIILDHSNNKSSVSNKIAAGLCISAFLFEASINEKSCVAINGGFQSLCFLLPSVEGNFLKSMLKCTLMLLSLIPELYEDESSINELKSTIDSLDELDGDDETFAICKEIIQLFQSPGENM